MTQTQTRPARAAVAIREQQQIAANVEKIEQSRPRQTAVQVMASRLNLDENLLMTTLKKTMFKDCRSLEEFTALVVVANEYGLNPMTKEIYAFPAKGGGVVPMVSIDGWVRIMNSHPEFDGIEFNDLPNEKGQLMAIEAVIYRRDRSRPIKVIEYLSECERPTDPWKKSPARMLRHRALIQCARYAFGFSGIYSDQEDQLEQIPYAETVPDTATARIPFNPETGEIDEEVERNADRAAYREMDGKNDDTPAPSDTAGPSGQEPAADGAAETQEEELSAAERFCRSWIDALGTADKAGVAKIETEFLNNRAALDDDQVKRVEDAIAARRKEVR